jgi:glycosyltransferase involved in cell wall biosynthesis
MVRSIALCIPAYNAAAHLPALFASVRAQTVPFDEVWVYDDASTDDTAAVARRFGARLVQGGANVGCSEGKNRLLAQVGTAWVHFHDADDSLAPEFVERSKARLSTDGLDVLLFDYEQVDARTGAQLSRSDFAASGLLADPLRYMLTNTVNNGGVYATALLRRLGGFDSDPLVLYNEDRAFHLRLAEAGARFGVEPYVGCRFHANPGSMSASNRARCVLAHQAITRRFMARHPGRYEGEVARLCWLNAAALASYLEWQAADECVALACRLAGRGSAAGGPVFAALCLLDPFLALRVRELLIRLLKPRFRQGYPQWQQDPKLWQFTRSLRD